MKQSQFWLLVAFMYLSSSITIPWIAILMGIGVVILSFMYRNEEDKE